MIKAVFFDIDGTLVSFDTHRVPASAIEALKRLKQKGILTFIATGRPYQAINNLGDLVFDGYVTLNGSLCINKRAEVIYKSPVLVSTLDCLIKYQQEKEAFPCIFVREKDFFINFINDRVREMIDLLEFPEIPVVGIEHVYDKDIFQIVAFFGPEKEEEIMKEALPGCDPNRWSPLFADVVYEGNSKKTGIEKMLAFYNISPGETMAFGDGGNDIPMLEYIPHSIAMGNAGDTVKKTASYVTESVDNDGIRKALEHFGVI